MSPDDTMNSPFPSAVSELMFDMYRASSSVSVHEVERVVALNKAGTADKSMVEGVPHHDVDMGQAVNCKPVDTLRVLGKTPLLLENHTSRPVAS